MFYTIRHITRFKYDSAVHETLMEVRKHPRTEMTQRCLSFQLRIMPKARTFWYRDYLGNTIYHFDVPGTHRQLVVAAEALVETRPPIALPSSLPVSAWHDLDNAVQEGDFSEMLMTSHYVRPSDALSELAAEIGVERRSDPLTLLREITAGVYSALDYSPRSTQVDSPIEVALRNRRGVCQDMTHILAALIRPLGIPCRYVSGYLYHPKPNRDRSVDGASHSWVECFLPELGWIGFDATNNLITEERHIRTAIGRDYADVPPTRGVFKGSAKGELTVAVRVAPSDAPPSTEPEFLEANSWNVEETVATQLREAEAERELMIQLQQQQQQ